MTLQEIANRLKSVSDTPLLDARLLQENCKDLEKAIQRRLKHEPVSKIIGKRGFWKSDFIITQDVLDPRPDSETLIESVLKTTTFPPKRILDIGVGSGCLLFTLLDEYKDARGVGIDKSIKALKIAGQNKKARKATLLERDFFDQNWEKDLGKFDLIVSNPPYIPSKDVKSLSLDVQNYDPLLALDGGVDGLDAYRKLARSIPALLEVKGYVFLEIGVHQRKDVQELFQKEGLTFIQAFKDFGGIERVLAFKNF